MRQQFFSTACGAALVCAAVCISSFASEESQKTALAIQPAFPDAKFRNLWDETLEKEYLQRASHTLELWWGKKGGGTTYGESEKNLYPTAMFAHLTGDRTNAIKSLESEDSQAKSDHEHTLGIDYYWCFTLKGQVRKYFFFGQSLAPDYRKRMLVAAKIWTEKDPLRRPHPKFGRGSGAKEGWGPEVKGGWVDARNTDNLRAMRDTSIYLFAEAAGNEATRLIYKDKIKDYVQTLDNIGMSEWDSPNYHGHTLAPYHNLFDFAKDEDVKMLAKAGLDWLYAVGAFKYYRGGFGGPNARDYGGEVVFAQSVTYPLWAYFGDTPQLDTHPDRDAVHHITSAYRPPSAVVALARKQFNRPVEVLSTHPPYKNWKAGQPSQPEFFETQFFGQNYQFGTVVSAGTGGLWNINTFKLVSFNSKRGSDFFLANSQGVFGHQEKRKGDQIAQYRNLAIWLRPSSEQGQPVSLCFQLPRNAKLVVEDGIWFAALEKTWLAIRPINLKEYATESFMSKNRNQDRHNEAKLDETYKDEIFLRALPGAGPYSGFALEIGEEPMSFDDFKKSVKTIGQLDLSVLEKGTVTLRSSSGDTLALIHNKENDLPTVIRNGTPVDWTKRSDPYLPVDGQTPIVQKWMSGALRVEAGGKVFESKISNDGKVNFSETTK